MNDIIFKIALIIIKFESYYLHYYDSTYDEFYLTAIFLSLEPVFAALFSVFFAGEILGFYGWIGGIIIVLSVMSSSFILPEFNEK